MFDSAEICFPEYIRLHARAQPEKTALIVGPHRLTWGEMESTLCRIGNALIALGVQQRERVAVLADISLPSILAEFGIVKAGAAVASLSCGVSIEDLVTMVRDADVRVVFVGASQVEKIEAILPSLSTRPILIGLDIAREGWLSFITLVEDASPEWARIIIAGEDPFYLTYSSGTTGAPKGIVLSHRSRVRYFQILAIELGFDADAIILSGTALYSTTTWTLLMLTFMVGGTIVVMEKFDAAEFCRLVAEHRVSHTIMVPAMWSRVLDLPGQAARLGSLRRIGSTGSMLSVDLKQRLNALVPGGLREVYGMTEGMVTVLRASDLPEHIASVGRPMLGNDFRIVGSDDREVIPGEPGEIVADSPFLLTEYFKQPAKTLEATWTDPTTGRKFLRSGDIGRFDEHGYLHLVDRKKDMIVSGGFNVYPADIERVLLRHPAVRDCCILGVPHPQWGETPLALIILRDGEPGSVEEIRAWVNQGVGKYQRLSAIEVRESFPRNAGGKVLKRELREPYWRT